MLHSARHIQHYQWGDIPVLGVTAPNKSPFTAEGTVTHIIGQKELAVIDPGPLNDEHLHNLLNIIDGRIVKAILISHTHLDHSPLGAKLSALTNAPIMGCMPYQAMVHPHKEQGLDASHDKDYAPHQILQDGAIIESREWGLEAITTPGHAANHMCFALKGEGVLFSGDHVMGWSTSIIAPPDGNMRDYINSLEKLLQREEDIYLPAHGDALLNKAKGYTRALKGHRLMRENMILDMMNEATSKDIISLEALLKKIYGDIKHIFLV